MTDTVRYILAPSADLSKTVEADITVEAEYGSYVAQGRVYTAAHHQPGMEHLPAPCNDQEIPALDSGTVLVSHVDLDTFGGCLRASGVFAGLFESKHQSFWDLAQFVDLNGPHKLSESGASEEDLTRLYAFWAWKTALPRFSRDEITDVTAHVIAAGSALEHIFDGSQTHIDAGIAMRTSEADLNRATFVGTFAVEDGGTILVRATSTERGFCNHLYADPTGKAHMAVAAWNKDDGGITISLADAVEGVSCRQVMQDLFGPEAGGHDGIAGSPREQAMTEDQFFSTQMALSKALSMKGGLL